MQANNLVAIITCQRPQGLLRLIKALQQQKTEESSFDILIVDNACQPDIAKLISSQAVNSHVSIYYEQESIPGIVAARNKCVSWFLKQQYNALVFIDDDEWPANENWLNKLVQAQKKYQSDIVTSHVISVGEQDTPGWAVKLIYGKNKFQEGQKLTTFYTNNLLIRRPVLQQLQPAFDQRFAMTGASDYHFALRCRKLGFTAYYTDAPVIEEFPTSRANLKWFLRRGFRSGIGYSRSHLFEERFIIAILLCIFMFAMRVARGCIKLLYGIVTLNRTRVTEGLFRFASAIGTLAGLFGTKVNEYRVIHGK
ncbi:MAG: glycosyltransferase [Paraglaciecola sp.]|uniref:glycosyltransferase family 2 protein n=1 Tax=Paraglaciecola sp. TaxID=1920173 RepID=UPI00273D2CA2|nr:glycosyltransferase [Paraglaciecola sp.]MDP5030746.1 glycosyltransferase [Paraglaciecola sp.]MDP5132304.1 glycosyltransferase [Paraglaciecola sp.]